MAKTYTCPSCGKSYTRRHTPESYIGNNCFDCSFWLDKAENSEFMASHQVIINGQHFMIGATENCIRGFGGRRFMIQFFDGRIIETNNLHGQGPIPERFRSMLPDNSIFIDVETENNYEKEGGAHV
jgi:hypothetical protein